MTPIQERMKQEFIARRGYWREWNEVLLRRDPAFLDAYGTYAATHRETGPLTGKQIELIYVALDASATHMFRNGLASHTQKAREAGVTEAELMHVFRLVVGQGYDVAKAAEQVLIDELAAQEVEALPPDLAWDARAQAAFGAEVQGGALRAQDEALIRVALHASLTAYCERALEAAIRKALTLSVAPAAIRQAIQLAAHLAVHACAAGLGVVDDELKKSELAMGQKG